ncbi:class II fructose-bisphosphate aldolase [Phaeovulum sp. W22_SRMD_FR3]|uniref:class II fructose-bisphosphate aldolase n=1 Tax=Phaeovulum sp. W22_SRMD_FR3 TaxID=3240274 RepID=UPI003F9A0978
MPLVSLRELLDHAAEHTYAIPAFNVNNMEQMQAIMQAADAVEAPVILQASRGARAYAGDVVLAHLIRAATEVYPRVPVCMHQDHGNSVATCVSAIRHGFTSVMMDGTLREDGKTLGDYSYNAAVTRETVRIAHMVGASVEGEIGHLGSLETGHGEAEDGHGFEGLLTRDHLLTKPDEAASFVADTGVDALAIAIGTSHGAYKFSRKPDGETLAVARLAEIHARLPHMHLVLHGASSVPDDLQEIINANGGALRPTFGVPLEEIEACIQLGVRKVNIDTDLRLALTGAIRRVLLRDPAEFDPRRYLGEGRSAMAVLCRDRFERFGAAGRAPGVACLPLDEMARRYRAAPGA